MRTKNLCTVFLLFTFLITSASVKNATNNNENDTEKQTVNNLEQPVAKEQMPTIIGVAAAN